VATKTIGTLATTTLTGFQLPAKYVGQAQISAADWATIANSIFDDSRNPQQLINQQIMNGALVRNGKLYVPNRGVLQINDGDWIAVDPNGWPILIGKESLPAILTATGNWSVAAGTAVTALSANVLQQGWWSGMAITGNNIAASTVISAIAANGLSLTLSKAATGTGTGATLTVGSWTHS
jgi:hypothetical protein